MGSKQHREKGIQRQGSRIKDRANKDKDAATKERVGGEVSVWPDLGPAGHRVVLRHSWSVVEERGFDQFSDKLYAKLYERDPSCRQLFANGLTVQKRIFPTILYSILDNQEAIKNLALYHAHLNISPSQVKIFCSCMLDSLLEVLAEDAVETVTRAWNSLFKKLEELFTQYLVEARNAIREIDGKKNEQAHHQYRALERSTRGSLIPVLYSGWLKQVKFLKKRTESTALTTVDRQHTHSTLHSPSHVRFNARQTVPPPVDASVRAPTYCLPRLPKFRPHETLHPSFHTPCAPPPKPVLLSPRSTDAYKLKPRWLEVKGQYLFYYNHEGDKPIGLVDLSAAEVVDEPDLPFAFSLRSGRVFSEVLTFVADGDNDKELWVVRLKRECKRFSYTRPFSIGQRVVVNFDPEVHGACTWLGSVEGTSLSWKAEGLWVGVELDSVVDGGHDGMFRGRRFFNCTQGHGVLVPSFKVTACESDSEGSDIMFRSEDFDFLAVLGKGSFGCVCKVREKNTGLIYACKVLQKAALVKDGQVSNLHREKSILFTVDHPYIVKLHAAFQTRSRLLLLFDFLSGGELWYHMAYEDGVKCDFTCFSESRARFYMAEVALAVGYLHSRSVLHRDLKLENLVLDSEGHVVLTDFGFAKTIDHDDAPSAQCGTIPYMAPEVLKREAYGYEVDWWSLGVVLFLMTTGCYPYWVSKADGSLDPQATITQILEGRSVGRGKFPDTAELSHSVQDLLTGLLEKSSKKRLTGLEALKKHPFFTGFDWGRCESRALEPPFIPSNKGPNTKYFHNFHETDLRELAFPSCSSYRPGEPADSNHFEHFSVARRRLSTISEDYDFENVSYLTAADPFVFETDT